MYSKVKRATAAKPKRMKQSRFEQTNEWRLLKRDLEKGLKPDEVLQLALTGDYLKASQIKNRVTVVRFIKRYLATHNYPYHVMSFRRDNVEYVQVYRPEDLEQRERTA
jgi:hypothetical protein